MALLKLVTDGSRPIGEMSDSWEKQQEKGTEYTGICFHGKHYIKKMCDTKSFLLLVFFPHLAVTDTVAHLIVFTVEGVSQEAQALQQKSKESSVSS